MADSPPDIDRLLLNHPSGDPRVIEAVVSQYRSALYRLSLSILGDADDAEDAVQRAFVSAAVRMESYRPGTNFRAWIFAIAVNTCRGELRKRKARQALLRLLGKEKSQPYDPYGAEEMIIHHEAGRRLWKAVGLLNEKLRLVILLRYDQELAVREIGQVLGLREKTVYSRLYEALRNLRLLLEDAGVEGEHLKEMAHE